MEMQAKSQKIGSLASAAGLISQGRRMPPGAPSKRLQPRMRQLASDRDRRGFRRLRPARGCIVLTQLQSGRSRVGLSDLCGYGKWDKPPTPSVPSETASESSSDVRSAFHSDAHRRIEVWDTEITAFLVHLPELTDRVLSEFDATETGRNHSTCRRFTENESRAPVVRICDNDM